MLPLSHLTSCTPTQSNLYLTNYLATVVSDPSVYSLLTFQVPNLMFVFHCLGCTKRSVQVKDNCNMAIVHSEELLALCPTPKLEDQPLSVVCDCLFNIFAANLHNQGQRGSKWPWGCIACWQPCTDKTQEMPFIPTKSHTCMSMSWLVGNIFDG